MALHKTIAIDAMGGDYGPEIIIPGVAMSLQELKQAKFLLYGDETRIKPVVDKYPELVESTEIIHTQEMVSNSERPSVALRTGRNSSMRLAINAVQENLAGSVVSCGNTGALMAMAKFVLKTLPGVHRPAIGSVFPSLRGDIVMLDLGANIICDSENLVQFAILGSIYAKIRRNDVNFVPSVGLLNVGTEDMKGKNYIREAGAILRNIDFPGKFYGFIEGNDIPKGTVDVVVTDGFTGNVSLKMAEGMGKLSGHLIKEAFRSSIMARLGGLLVYPAMKKMKRTIDPRYYNGGVFLGLDGICVKSHGNSDSYGVSRAIRVASVLADENYLEKVGSEIGHLAEQELMLPEDFTE